MTPKNARKGGGLWRRVLRLGIIALVGSYLLAVTAGYLWLRYSRHVEGIGFLQVALLRSGEIKRIMAAQQFAQAKKDVAVKNFQSAYVNFISAVGRDPANVTGRIEAAQFLGGIGAVNLEINLLEEGLARTPDDRLLNETLFGRLLSVGRDRHVLDLLQGKYAPGLSGPNAALLQAAELQATLAVNGGPAALALLGRYPGLRQEHKALMVVARVLWAGGEADAAINLMTALIQAEPDFYSGYGQLASWEFAAGRPEKALATALKACERYPQDPAPRVMALEISSARILNTPAWTQQVAIYLRDFSARPEAIVLLAELAGKHGWLELVRSLYDIASVRHEDLGRLVLCYSDALAARSMVPDARAVLAQIETQIPEGNLKFQQQLRQRQVLLAAAAGDREGEQEYARRLAGLLRGDTDAFARYRQYFQSFGLNEAVAEFAESKPRRPAPKPEKS